MTIPTYAEAWHQVSTAGTFWKTKHFWRAYKNGKTKSFATKELALMYSNLVEPATKQVRAVSAGDEYKVVKNFVIQQIMDKYPVNRLQFNLLYAHGQELVAQEMAAGNNWCTLEVEFNRTIAATVQLIELFIEVGEVKEK